MLGVVVVVVVVGVVVVVVVYVADGVVIVAVVGVVVDFGLLKSGSGLEWKFLLEDGLWMKVVGWGECGVGGEVVVVLCTQSTGVLGGVKLSS